MMTTRLRALPVVTLLAAVLSLSACSDDSREKPQAAGNTTQSTNADATTSADNGDDSYLKRLTPVARIKQAVEIRVEGNDAWVTVPVESTSPSAVVTCLQLLPAAKAGEETLTVIYSDGVEELCEWPE